MKKESLFEIIVPKIIKNRINPEVSSINNFMNFVSTQVKNNDLILDAGAGDCQYKDLFIHAKYESTDFEDVFDQNFKDKHTFTCDLSNIPRKTNFYNVIINTQVLEHVPEPQNVLNELYRVLKKNGKLFVTVPQCWGIHGKEPYNYFFFTKFGLEKMLKSAGFKIKFIRPRGGLFWLIGALSVTLPMYIFHQHVFHLKGGKNQLNFNLKALFIWPIYLVSIPLFVLIIPLICYHLDFLDKKKKFTLGYECYCIK